MDYLEDALLRSAGVNTELKQRLNLFPNSPVARPLHTKERNSMLALIAALKESRNDKDDQGLVRNIQVEAEGLGLNLSANTIRKWLDEAANELTAKK